MTERKLKKRILTFMMISKVSVVLFIVFHWQTGGYSLSEMLATLALILPLFTVYMAIIFKDNIRNPYKADETESPEVSSNLVRWTNFAFPIYLIVILYLINLKPQPGAFNFEHLQTSVGLLESGFGIYIAQIVTTLFKKGNS